MKADRVIHKNRLATTDIEDLADYYRQEAGLTVAMRFIDSAEKPSINSWPCHRSEPWPD